MSFLSQQKKRPFKASRQEGAVLAISLFFLVVLTMMGTFAVKTSVLQERMVGNMGQLYSAQQLAESALREAETCVGNFSVLPTVQGSPNPNGIGCDGIEILVGRQLDPPKDYYPEAMAAYFSLPTAGQTDDQIRIKVLAELTKLQASDWQALGQKTVFPLPDQVTTNPRFVIEEVRCEPDSLTVGTGVPPGRHVYQITAVGYAGTDTVFKVLQSQYLQRY